MTTPPGPFETIGKRTFRQALIRLFETEYKIMGSHRVLEMMADDILALMDEFHPMGDRLKAGELVWTTTARTQQKPNAGQRAEEYAQITVAVPWVTPDDLLVTETDRRRGRDHNIARAVRVVNAVYAAGGLLTLAELAAMFNTVPETVGQWLQVHYQRTGDLLPTKGQVLDMGSQPSHKDIVIHLYEQKIPAVEIARRTYHYQTSVDRYIQDYERVKMLLGKGMSLDEISHATGRGVSTVRQYCKLAWHYHPEMKPTPTDEPTSNPAKT